MKGWIEQTNTDRQPFHDFEKRNEISALHWEQPLQCRRAIFRLFREDHLAHHDQALFLEEHVLCPAEADALRFEHPGCLGFRRRIRIGTNANVARVVGPGQEPLEGIVDRGLEEPHFPGEHLSAAAVKGDDVSFVEDASVIGCQRLLAVIDVHARGPDHARKAKAARNDRSMARGSAAFRQDSPPKRACRAHLRAKFPGGRGCTAPLSPRFAVLRLRRKRSGPSQRRGLQRFPGRSGHAWHCCPRGGEEVPPEPGVQPAGSLRLS